MMKKNIYKIFIYGALSVLLGGLYACESFLDKEPATDVNPEAAFLNFYNFQGFTEELYHCIPDFAKREYNNMWNFGEEEYYSNNGRNELVARIDRGDFWAAEGYWLGMNAGDFNPAGDRWVKYLWPGAWYGISKANLGIANLDKLNGTQEERDLIAGQLYFFRAWFHLHLINFWGGMPYVDTVLPSNEKLTLPRLSYQQCADKVAADFEKAAELLPMHWDDVTSGTRTAGNNELRINKIMALAYLGKTYLYAGSPLMNKESTGNASYNADYCKKSAEVFGEVLKLVENGQTKYDLVPFSKYRELYQTNGQSGRMPGSTEAIFRGPSYGGTGLSLDKQYLAARVLQDRSWSLYPTANYANYFGMVNGLPINAQNSASVADPVSGYDPQYPWKNRDPRFYLTYAFDTQRMIMGNPGAANEKWRFANLYSYGGPQDDATYRHPETGSPTGYLLIKFNLMGMNKFDNSYDNHHIHISWMRLADVYLMYAEAVANGYGSPSSSSNAYSSLTALDAVDKIRKRATVGVFAPQFRGSLEAFMQELRRERAVELAWEGHRFNDLRRWLLFDKHPYTLKTRIEFNRAEPVNFNKEDPTQNRVLNLREEVILERKFTEKHYWFPLRRNDTNIYPEFYQNPGW